jgi:ABC-type sugar transport system ATPase subunit
MTLPNYPRIGMRFLLRLRKEYQLCEEYGRKVALKWPSPLTAVHLLSGGNQQKLLIARWLMAHARFLIVDEPTRGIDVGAKRDVYRLLAEQAEQGKAVLMISSELPELFGLCDRILVMRRGRLAADLPTRQTSPEEVMHYAAVQESPV